MINVLIKKLTVAAITGLGFIANGVLADAYATFKQAPNADNAFAYLHQVATSPRCANCHGTVENGVHRPTVGDDRRPHPMGINSSHNLILHIADHKIKQAPTDRSLRCTSCHQEENGIEPGSPPGAANDLMPGFLWHMPAATMAIPFDMSAADLCQRWLDPAQNSSHLAMRGGRNDLKTFKKEFLDHHAKVDPLIIWSWQPGPGRKPAPGTHGDFLKAMGIWVKAGAPCPE